MEMSCHFERMQMIGRKPSGRHDAFSSSRRNLCEIAVLKKTVSRRSDTMATRDRAIQDELPSDAEIVRFLTTPTVLKHTAKMTHRTVIICMLRVYIISSGALKHIVWIGDS